MKMLNYTYDGNGDGEVTFFMNISEFKDIDTRKGITPIQTPPKSMKTVLGDILTVGEKVKVGKEQATIEDIKGGKIKVRFNLMFFDWVPATRCKSITVKQFIPVNDGNPFKNDVLGIAGEDLKPGNLITMKDDGKFYNTVNISKIKFRFGDKLALKTSPNDYIGTIQHVYSNDELAIDFWNGVHIVKADQFIIYEPPKRFSEGDEVIVSIGVKRKISYYTDDGKVKLIGEPKLYDEDDLEPWNPIKALEKYANYIGLEMDELCDRDLFRICEAEE